MSDRGAPVSGVGPDALARLRHRRQYVIGTAPAAPPPEGWRRAEVDPRHFADVHPDLGLSQATDGARRITLLGFALDASDPAATDERILERLLAGVARGEDAFAATAALGGRWVMAVHDGTRTSLFTDAGGQRTLYYRAGGGTPVLCASQPGLVGEPLGLAVDEAARDFVRARGPVDCEVYWLPGDTSPYAEVRALLPNHVLDLDAGAARRAWPTEDVPAVVRDAAVAESLRLMRGQIEAARRRFPLAISLTAGWDSRLMLALCRDAAADLHCFTLSYPGVPDTARDIAVPARLLAKLGIGHHLLRYPDPVDPAFRELYKRNTSSLSEAYCADGQALHERYPGDRVCVTGDVAEVVKVHYRPKKAGAVTPKDLAAFCAFPPHPFALAAFERWLHEAAPRNVPLLDLFCWEQMGGRWQSLIRAEYDVAQESFAPLGCRALLVTMLGVDEAERRGPEFRMLRELIERLWPEVLAEPINPKEPVRPKDAAIRLLRRLHVYEPLRRLVRRARGRPV